MEELITGMIKAVMKTLAFIIRLIAEFFMDIVQGICEWLIEKCYKKYPKLTIIAFIVLIVMTIVMIMQVLSLW